MTKHILNIDDIKYRARYGHQLINTSESDEMK